MVERSEPGDHLLLEHFADLMRDRLAYGREQGHIHWGELNPSDLLQWLMRDLGSLSTAVMNRNAGRVEERCAELANLAAMLAARVRGLRFDDWDVVPDDPEEGNEP